MNIDNNELFSKNLRISQLIMAGLFDTAKLEIINLNDDEICSSLESIETLLKSTKRLNARQLNTIKTKKRFLQKTQTNREYGRQL